jgi:hypothetical protein
MLIKNFPCIIYERKFNLLGCFFVPKQAFDKFPK